MAISKKIITKEDLGIENVAEEFATRNGAQQAIKFIFKWTGLNAVDGLGKNTIINANLKKMTKQAQSNNKELNDKLEFYFGEKANQVRQDIIDGNITDDVLLLSYRALADLQPLTRDQLPTNYSKFGNLRIIYQLKTYAIKSFDIARQDCFDKIRSGDKKLIIEGFGNLLRLAGMLMLFNVPVDMLIDFIKGREINLTDSILDSILIYPLFNRFTTTNFNRGGLKEVFTNLFTPVAVKTISDITSDIVSKKDIQEVYSWSYMPFVGDFYYGNFGGGKDK